MHPEHIRWVDPGTGKRQSVSARVRNHSSHVSSFEFAINLPTVTESVHGSR